MNLARQQPDLNQILDKCTQISNLDRITIRKLIRKSDIDTIQIFQKYLKKQNIKLLQMDLKKFLEYSKPNLNQTSRDQENSQIKQHSLSHHALVLPVFPKKNSPKMKSPSKYSYMANSPSLSPPKQPQTTRNNRGKNIIAQNPRFTIDLTQDTTDNSVDSIQYLNEFEKEMQCFSNMGKKMKEFTNFTDYQNQKYVKLKNDNRHLQSEQYNNKYKQKESFFGNYEKFQVDLDVPSKSKNFNKLKDKLEKSDDQIQYKQQLDSYQNKFSQDQYANNSQNNLISIQDNYNPDQQEETNKSSKNNSLQQSGQQIQEVQFSFNPKENTFQIDSKSPQQNKQNQFTKVENNMNLFEDNGIKYLNSLYDPQTKQQDQHIDDLYQLNQNQYPIYNDNKSSQNHNSIELIEKNNSQITNKINNSLQNTNFQQSSRYGNIVQRNSIDTVLESEIILAQSFGRGTIKLDNGESEFKRLEQESQGKKQIYSMFQNMKTQVMKRCDSINDEDTSYQFNPELYQVSNVINNFECPQSQVQKNLSKIQEDIQLFKQQQDSKQQSKKSTSPQNVENKSSNIHKYSSNSDKSNSYISKNSAPMTIKSNPFESVNQSSNNDLMQTQNENTGGNILGIAMPDQNEHSGDQSINTDYQVSNNPFGDLDQSSINHQILAVKNVKSQQIPTEFQGHQYQVENPNKYQISEFMNQVDSLYQQIDQQPRNSSQISKQTNKKQSSPSFPSLPDTILELRGQESLEEEQLNTIQQQRIIGDIQQLIPKIAQLLNKFSYEDVLQKLLELG